MSTLDFNFHIGDRVIHEEYGIGTILTRYSASGQKRYKVQFASHGYVDGVELPTTIECEEADLSAEHPESDQ